MTIQNEITSKYRLCSNVSFNVYMNPLNDNGTKNDIYYLDTTKQYFDFIQNEERKLTKIQDYGIDGMATSLFLIARQIFTNINFAKKENVASDAACIIGHQKIKPHFDFLKTVITSIRYIGQSNPVDMIEMSRYYLDQLRAFYVHMNYYHIDLKISPLEPYFNELVSELNDLCSNERIKQVNQLNKLKRNSMKQTDKAKNLFEYLQVARVKAHFTKLKPDFSNVDDVYKNYLTLWFYNESDVKTLKTDITNDWINNPDNVEFCKTKKGFKLLETDFINHELSRLKEVKSNELTLIEKKQFDFYKKYLKGKLEKPQKNDEPYKSYDWFIIGLSFATGEMDKLLKDYNNNYTDIANLHFKRENLRPCITASNGANRATNKNLFNSRSKMLKIIEYCSKNGIEVIPSFTDRLPPE